MGVWVGELRCDTGQPNPDFIRPHVHWRMLIWKRSLNEFQPRKKNRHNGKVRQTREPLSITAKTQFSGRHTKDAALPNKIVKYEWKEWYQAQDVLPRHQSLCESKGRDRGMAQ